MYFIITFIVLMWGQVWGQQAPVPFNRTTPITSIEEWKTDPQLRGILVKSGVNPEWIRKKTDIETDFMAYWEKAPVRDRTFLKFYENYMKQVSADQHPIQADWVYYPDINHPDLKFNEIVAVYWLGLQVLARVENYSDIFADGYWMKARYFTLHDLAHYNDYVIEQANVAYYVSKLPRESKIKQWGNKCAQNGLTHWSQLIAAHMLNNITQESEQLQEAVFKDLFMCIHENFFTWHLFPVLCFLKADFLWQNRYFRQYFLYQQNSYEAIRAMKQEFESDKVLPTSPQEFTKMILNLDFYGENDRLPMYAMTSAERTCFIESLRQCDMENAKLFCSAIELDSWGRLSQQAQEGLIQSFLRQQDHLFPVVFLDFFQTLVTIMRLKLTPENLDQLVPHMQKIFAESIAPEVDDQGFFGRHVLEKVRPAYANTLELLWGLSEAKRNALSNAAGALFVPYLRDYERYVLVRRLEDFSDAELSKKVAVVSSFKPSFQVYCMANMQYSAFVKVLMNASPAVIDAVRKEIATAQRGILTLEALEEIFEAHGSENNKDLPSA